MRLVFPLVLAGCLPEDTAYPDDPIPRTTTSVTGALERVDPDDLTSPWVGVEVVQVTDGDGTCVLTRKIEAWEADGGCEGCDVVLEQVTVVVLDEVTDCASDLSLAHALASSIGFRPTEVDPFRGEVLVGDGDGWELYSTGSLEDGALTWHHVDEVGSGSGGRPRDPDVREPHPPPIVP